MKQFENEILIVEYLIPARSWHYMYATTDKGNLYVYAHRPLVSFFATHDASDISSFQDIVTKLRSLQYFSESLEFSVEEQTDKIDFKNPSDIKLKIGTCLVSFRLMENLKADVWVNNETQKVEFHLRDADEYKLKLDTAQTLP